MLFPVLDELVIEPTVNQSEILSALLGELVIEYTIN